MPLQCFCVAESTPVCFFFSDVLFIFLGKPFRKPKSILWFSLSLFIFLSLSLSSSFSPSLSPSLKQDKPMMDSGSWVIRITQFTPPRRFLASVGPHRAPGSEKQVAPCFLAPFFLWVFLKTRFDPLNTMLFSFFVFILCFVSFSHGTLGFLSVQPPFSLFN